MFYSLIQAPGHSGLGQLYVVLVDIEGVLIGRKEIRGRHTYGAQTGKAQRPPGVAAAYDAIAPHRRGDFSLADVERDARLSESGADLPHLLRGRGTDQPPAGKM